MPRHTQAAVRLAPDAASTHSATSRPDIRESFSATRERELLGRATADLPSEDRTTVRRLRTLYVAGFVTAFGAHAVAANLERFANAHHASLLDLGILLALYDGAEVVLKPASGALTDRIGSKPVLIGGLVGSVGVATLAGGRSSLWRRRRASSFSVAAIFAEGREG